MKTLLELAQENDAIAKLGRMATAAGGGYDRMQVWMRQHETPEITFLFESTEYNHIVKHTYNIEKESISMEVQIIDACLDFYWRVRNIIPELFI